MILIFLMFMINLSTVPASCPRQFSYLDFLLRTVGKQLVVRDTILYHLLKGMKEMYYLMTHSTHLIYGYMVLDI